MATAEKRGTSDHDRGVVPVIAVVVLVLIAVVLAAGLYLWLDGFRSEEPDTERAAVLSERVDWDEDGNVEWIRLTLTEGDTAPYDGDEVTLTVTDPTGSTVEDVCKSPHAEAGTDCNSDPDTSTADMAFDSSDASGDSWGVGEDLWVPCQGEGNHPVTVSVADTVILDAVFACEASAS